MTSTTNPTFTILKQATCPTLSQSGTIGYQIALDDGDNILMALASNSGTGFFCKAWIKLDHALDTLEEFAIQYPLTSLALQPLYPGTSINSWSFLMAVLLAEGLIEPLSDNKRRFQLCDPAPFRQQIEKLKAAHSDSPKGKDDQAA
ncbi:hypothetical protein BST95_19040 [Halioglobus japonicus]|uniref:Uncharacterized protein n=1 Tax=Halioglobus japonicus TaxID=930805 RepID=A0AAP8MBI3_9GAMM|nr:hypothetical protein [Halioglobus japonicus]AQA20024.1 hypothetical protein BST95_19040 [Halioglobus japonicus]PLW84681.1 hypothetical protein C0029_16880 [Halioglobus japonicus]GHD20881.1 hypothetical protein GCM10007052_30970 [Halioglobus japonicus]